VTGSEQAGAVQCVAVCCSVLQCVAAVWPGRGRQMWCSVLQCECVAVCCSVLQCVAVCCSMAGSGQADVVQCVAVFSGVSVLQCECGAVWQDRGR